MDPPWTPFPDPEALETFLHRPIKSVPNFAKLVSKPKVDEPLPLPIPPRAPEVDAKTGIRQSFSPLFTKKSADAFNSPYLNNGGYRAHGSLTIRPRQFGDELSPSIRNSSFRTTLSVSEAETEIDTSKFLSVPKVTPQDHRRRPISPKSARLNADSDKENVPPSPVQMADDYDSGFEDELPGIKRTDARTSLFIKIVDAADEPLQGLSSDEYYADNEDSDGGYEPTISKQQNSCPMFKKDSLIGGGSLIERPMKRPRFEIYSADTPTKGNSADKRENYIQMSPAISPKKFNSLPGGSIPECWCVPGLTDRLSEWWVFGIEASRDNRITPRATKPRQLDIVELVILCERPGKLDDREICRFDLSTVAQIKLWECDVVGEYSDDEFITDQHTMTTRWTWIEIKEKRSVKPTYLRKRSYSSTNPALDINGNPISRDVPEQPWQVIAFPSAYITGNDIRKVLRPSLKTSSEPTDLASAPQRSAGFSHFTALRPKVGQLRLPGTSAKAPSKIEPQFTIFGSQQLEDPFWVPHSEPVITDENTIDPRFTNPYPTGSPMVNSQQMYGTHQTYRDTPMYQNRQMYVPQPTTFLYPSSSYPTPSMTYGPQMTAAMPGSAYNHQSRPQVASHGPTDSENGFTSNAAPRSPVAHPPFYLSNTDKVFRARVEQCRAFPLVDGQGVDLIKCWFPVADAFLEGELKIQYIVKDATERTYTSPAASSRFSTPGMSSGTSNLDSGVGTPLSCHIARDQAPVPGRTVVRDDEVKVELDLQSVGNGKTEVHAWQYAMLGALAENKPMPWEGWTERSKHASRVPRRKKRSGSSESD